MIHWVGQKHSRGCGIAALAMLTGHDYDRVAAYFPVDLNQNGIYLLGLDDYLVDHGFAVARKKKYLGFFGSNGAVPRLPWPPEPFGDVHVCEVEVCQGAPCYHFVVLLRDGTVLDPLTEEKRGLSDYHQVLNVAAVVPRKGEPCEPPPPAS